MRNKKRFFTACAMALVLALSSCQGKAPASSQGEESETGLSSGAESSQEESGLTETNVVFNEDHSVSIAIEAELPQAETRQPIRYEAKDDYQEGSCGDEYIGDYPADVQIEEGFSIPKTVGIYQYQQNEDTLAVVEIFKSLYPDHTMALSGHEDNNVNFYGSCAQNTRWYETTLEGTEGTSRCDFNLSNGYMWCYWIPIDFKMDPDEAYEFDVKALAEIACQTAMKFHSITGDVVLTGYEEDFRQLDFSYSEDGVTSYTQYATAKFRFTPVAPHSDPEQSCKDYMEIVVAPDGQVYTIENYISTAEIKKVGEVDVLLTEDELKNYFSASPVEGDTVTILSARAYGEASVDVDILRPVVEITYRLESDGKEHICGFAANEKDTFALFGGKLGGIYD